MWIHWSWILLMFVREEQRQGERSRKEVILSTRLLPVKALSSHRIIGLLVEGEGMLHLDCEAIGQ